MTESTPDPQFGCFRNPSDGADGQGWRSLGQTLQLCVMRQAMKAVSSIRIPHRRGRRRHPYRRRPHARRRHALVGAAKRPTTADVTSGIRDALGEALRQLPRSSGKCRSGDGRHHPSDQCPARTEAPLARPPCCVWRCPPPNRCLPLKSTGPRNYRPMPSAGTPSWCGVATSTTDGRSLLWMAREFARRSIEMRTAKASEAVAISGVFSPVNPRHENEAAADHPPGSCPILRVSPLARERPDGPAGERERRRAQRMPGRCRRPLGPGASATPWRSASGPRRCRSSSARTTAP